MNSSSLLFGFLFPKKDYYLIIYLGICVLVLIFHDGIISFPYKISYTTARPKIKPESFSLIEDCALVY